MLDGTQRGVCMVAKKPKHLFPADEIQLARLHGFNRQLIRTASNDCMQSQDLASFRDSNNQCLAVARGSGKLCSALAEYENPPRILAFHQNHSVFRENGSMFDLVEGCN